MKKSHLLLLVLVLVSWFINSCEKGRANYYRKVVLDGRYQIIGKYPVSDNVAHSTNCYHFTYDENGRVTKIEYLERGNSGKDPYFGVSKIIIEYSEGFEKRIYQDAKGKPMASNNFVHSIMLKLNEKGYPVSLFNFDKKGKLGRDRYGVAQYLWTLDEEGRRITSVCINQNGDRTINKYEIALVRYKYDEQGNTIEEDYFGTNEQLKEDKDLGIAIIRRKYDERGNMVEERYYGTDEKLKENRNSGVAIIRCKYNEQGNTVEEKFFGTDEHLKENKNSGAAIIHYKYDENGNTVEEKFFGTDEQLKEHKLFKRCHHPKEI